MIGGILSGGDGNLPPAINTNAQNAKAAKALSKVWNKLKNFSGKTKTNGLSGKKRKYFEWDHTHGDVEVYDSNGKHIGTIDPETGKPTKPPVPGRNIGL